VTALVNDPDETRAHDNFAAFCMLARELDLAVSIEFMAFSSLTTIEAGAAFVAASGQSNATILVDALHLQRTGGTPDSLAAIPPALIGSAQLCDAPVPGTLDPFKEAVEDRMIPGEGDLPLGSFLEALRRDVQVDIETPLGRLREEGVAALDRARLVVDATRCMIAEHPARLR
jgi:sugar phosphate isomerase/epimerase